jgi:DNA-binding transcriptional LysR family regulator
MRDLNSLDWDDLKVFLHAARGGSLGSASKRLRLDQSTISRRIAHLESTLGLAVFERLPSGLKVNETGYRLLKHAERIESSFIAMQEEVRCGVDTMAGRVRLATMEGIASLFLAAKLSPLRRTHPDLVVELLTSSQSVSVNRREADLFLSFFKPPGQGLISEKLGCFALNLYASQAYLDDLSAPITTSDLDHHPFVTYIDDRIQLDSVRWLDDVITEPTISFHSNSMIAQLNAAAGGLGLVLLPTFAVIGRNDLVPVLHDEISTTRELWLSVHTDLQFVPRIRAVAGFLKTLFKSELRMQAAPRQPLPPVRPTAARTRKLSPRAGAIDLQPEALVRPR